MGINKRFFQINGQWSVIHYPDQPNGFAIMIIGNKQHYVDESSSLWIQSPDRYKMLETLRKQGYTIFYSNLYGANWGSPESIDTLEEMYQLIIRQEILNKKVHLLAEGMGGITAVKIMGQLKEAIRSAALLSPCVDIKEQFIREKESRLFYKRFIKELANAYHVPEKNVVKQIIEPFNIEDYDIVNPIKVWHVTDRTTYNPTEHSRKLEGLCLLKDVPFELSFHLYEKRHHLGKSIYKFFQKNEKSL